MKITLTASSFKYQYIDYLNQCFSGWGDEQAYDWTFESNIGNGNADVFIIEEENEVIAGSTLTYRTILLPNATQLVHGTMTGSWTLPAARGKGCFTEIIQYSLQLIKEHQYQWLSAFVTETNASFRRLKAAGSFLVPTYYIVGKIPENILPIEGVNTLPITDENIYKIWHLRNTILENAARYNYSKSEFQHQFIDRPSGNSKIISYENHYFIIEETSTTFRILWASTYDYNIIQKLMHWAANFNKNIFFFTTKLLTDYFDNDSINLIKGFFTVIGASDQAEVARLLSNVHLHIDYGDKM